ncbi:SGNH/GDSL hydrolase family protein [Granulicella tundricola]|uniref:Lipolytic protein G-D-S-L family n=1 Tax=Granulicella tundricola (strain ATCC BAA-1859 / DSM 23138 / MP5ACTX9) TaxID=1198114 RepID=E8WZW5_GRATM|nr:Ig-like domain repeat protein [Granulicella tundricola]ADW67776.1 lipolytic protein G-D-S-L family [Granulicella tundricola MP5ACTX9]
MSALRHALTVALLVFSAVLLHAQAYTSIVVIGDSLSDTGNDAHVSTALYTAAAAVPTPATGYTQGSFTDGADTAPAAQLYSGVWIKQLAAMLAAKPPVLNSLDGGANYAYGFAFTGSGTTPFAYGPGNVFTFPVNNMGLQLSTYLATNPTITSKTLFVVWGGANDILNATSSAAVTTAAANEAAVIQALIAAGATDFIIPNLPPLGAVPRLNTTASAASATAAAAGFNQALAAYVAALPAANPGKSLHLYSLDVFTLFNTIIAAPSTYGFANVTISSNFLAVNPDTYLFWDGLHPTTAGHHQLALAAAALIAPGATTTTLASSNLSANLNASVTLTATVKSPAGIPTGVVTFFDGTTAIGNGQLNTAGVATYTTSSLTAGTHNITAAYVASQYFNASTSTALSEVVTAPAISLTATPVGLTIASGSTGSEALTVATVGGLSGTVSLSCAPLPSPLTCTFSPATLTFAGANNTLTSTLTVNTAGVNISQLNRTRPGSNTLQAIAACSLLPFFGVLVFRRRHLRSLPLLCLLLLFSSGAVLGLSGCSGSSSANAPKGLYTIPVTATGGSATSSLSFVVTVN